MIEAWEYSRSDPEWIDRLIPILKQAGFRSKDVDDFYDRFLPAGCRPQFTKSDVFMLMGYLADGAILADRQKPYETDSEAHKIDVPWKDCKETEVHHRLKQEATQWLAQKGIKNPKYEAGYYAGICDVTDGETWFVECGASRPSKVTEMFSFEKARDNKLVLFNDCGITVFESGPKIAEYWEALSIWRAKLFKTMDL